jgi:tetratricopeptide (TPR) repeat protein
VIREAERRVAADPDFVPGLTALATGYFARAGATGDPTWLTRADEAGRRAVAADPVAFEAMDALAEVAASRHRFREALAWTRRSLAIEPTRVVPLSIRTDALIELGRYEQGFATAQRRLELRPDLASYSRASYARELVGDRAGAVRLMRMAVAASAPFSGERATARAQLGLVLLAQGDLDAAEREVRTALAEVPGDANATFVRAQVLVARGRLRQALPLFERVAAALPEPDHLFFLAETERALGRTADARRHEAAMRRAFALLEANGQDVDLDRALFEADLRRPTAADIARARRGRAARPGIAGDHALGWVLTRAGRCGEADRHATRSLRLGTRDPLMLFHAGMAAACAGRPAAARARIAAAVRLNPAFSLRWAPVARAMLEGDAS